MYRRINFSLFIVFVLLFNNCKKIKNTNSIKLIGLTQEIDSVFLAIDTFGNVPIDDIFLDKIQTKIINRNNDSYYCFDNQKHKKYFVFYYINGERKIKYFNFNKLNLDTIIYLKNYKNFNPIFIVENFNKKMDSIKFEYISSLLNYTEFSQYSLKTQKDSFFLTPIIMEESDTMKLNIYLKTYFVKKFHLYKAYDIKFNSNNKFKLIIN